MAEADELLCAQNPFSPRAIEIPMSARIQYVGGYRTGGEAVVPEFPKRDFPNGDRVVVVADLLFFVS